MAENSHKPEFDVVELFRKSGRPEWCSGQFKGQLDYAQAQSRDLLDRLRRQDREHGYLADLIVDNIFVSDEDDLPSEGRTAEFVFKTAYQGSARFFLNAAELAAHPPLGRGKLPDQFYLVEEDYQHGTDESVPDSVKRLKDLTDFVNTISQLSDQKFVTEGSGAWTLVFQTGDGMGLLETRFGEELLNMRAPEVAWEAVKSLTADPGGIHQKEKVLMFKSVMCEFLNRNVEFHEFIKAAENWAKKYNNDLDRYLRKFSLDEVKREIAKEDTRFSEQLSRMLGDVTVKILGLPLSLALLMVVRTQSAALPWWFLALILACISIIVGILVSHHIKTLERVEINIKMVFGKLQARNNGPSTSSREEELDRVMESLDIQTKQLKKYLRIYRFAAWAVPILGGFMLCCNAELFGGLTTELLNHAQIEKR